MNSYYAIMDNLKGFQHAFKGRLRKESVAFKGIIHISNQDFKETYRFYITARGAHSFHET